MKDSQKEIDEIAAQVELAADVQAAEAAQEDKQNVEEMTEEELEKAAEEEAGSDHTLILSKTYKMDGKMIDRINFEGLEELKTKDLEYADRVIARMNHAPDDKFTDVLWNRMIAVRATGLSGSFFNELSSRDMLGVVGVIRQFFLFGWE
jgi:hypothetical protein|nr:MAG TPA: tail assembly chaperone protein [Bacteriophage sp.]